ncbi:hypothetical protein H6F59_16615 [Nodosilinea sp. FACHB-141]|uniref:XRE family transcriptional regulator n=1 Tax=Leptolyngbya subtilissima DQ-A4 TaxID=2933933 RepID=A0ABV0K3U4_9CYAN|nr:hypothetical protein [Nodosilinea sp. FACHB-141]MBD2113449.1 hypothetical protein [Nodosilinea sp. FACHB-141]
MQNYYPWNTQALVDWLNQELRYRTRPDLEAALKVERHVIKSWLTKSSPAITLTHLRAIAEYRGWTLDQTVSWLGLQPAHVQELINQDSSGVRESLR